MHKIKRYLRRALLRSFFSPTLKEHESRVFREKYEAFSKLAVGKDDRFEIRWQDTHPILGEDTPGHSFDRHYIYHVGWAARKVREIAPEYHVDISSSLYFSSIVSAFIPFRFFDYRVALLHLDNLTCGQADLHQLQFPDNSLPSLSCMHVVEHIGLGRYGDPLDPLGDLQAMRELSRVIMPRGSLLFVVPVGVPRVCFNSHRVYGYEQIIQAFSGLTLAEISLIPDNKQQPILLHANPDLVADQDYACGCFWFRK